MMTTHDAPDSSPLLEVKNLRKHFLIHSGLLSRAEGRVHAVDGVTFSVKKGETFGLVGESGCGKTTVGRTLLGLTPATSGEVRFDGKDVFSLSRSEMRYLRREMQIIFQDPYSSLNPRLTAGAIIAEPLIVHGLSRGAELRARVREMLRVVGLQDSDYGRYPHEFSGGQRQRIGIARVLTLNPKLIVCDEPVSALDVSIQSQILNLLDRLQDEFGLTYIFITHGMNVVKHVSDHVGIMYLGKMVEVAPCDLLFRQPNHPYTEALLSAIPVPDPRHRTERVVLEGDVPSPIKPPPGCRFHTRCRYVMKRCTEEEPLLTEVEEGQWLACFRNRSG